jgi:hypothetical protein
MTTMTYTISITEEQRAMIERALNEYGNRRGVSYLAPIGRAAEFLADVLRDLP